MPWNRTNPEKERMAFVSAYQQERDSMLALCRAFGVSRTTGYRWVQRVAAEGPRGCCERSRAPKHHPQAVAAELRAAVVAERLAHPTWGPRKLRAHLAVRQPEQVWPAASTMGTFLALEGLVVPRRKRRASPPYTQPFLACQGPNDVWCADFKGWFRTSDGVRCDPLTLTDGYSRTLLRCVALRRPTLEEVRPIFEAAFHEYGLPVAIRTDNGPPFASTSVAGLSALSLWWLKLGILPERIRPGHPEENGRHERMHRTLKAETATPPAANRAAQQAAFDRFREEYNTVRPHEALGQRPPRSRYVPSPRPYPQELREFSYPSADAQRQVNSNGAIKWHQHWIFLSEVLGGEPVGLYHRASGLWEVQLGPLTLGAFQDQDPEPKLRPSRDPWSKECR